MKKLTLTFCALFALFAAAPAIFADGPEQYSGKKEVMQPAPPVCDFYRAHEWDLGIWASWSFAADTGHFDVPEVDPFFPDTDPSVFDNIQFYTSATGSKTTTNLASLGTLRYSMDTAGGDNTVQFDAGRNHGSGSGDAFLYIPTSAFAGTNANDFVYMYVNFGNADMTTAGGFEEFTLVRNLAPVPEMSALFPIVGLIVAVGSTSILRRRRMSKVNS